MAFKKAVRSAVRVRIALAGPSGSGKTYTALTFAHALGKKIAVVDTERGSASTYVGVNNWQFDVDEPSNFDPGQLARTIRQAATEGYDVVIIDSFSHYWEGTGGSIELSEKLQSGGNKFSGWAKVKERERDMMDAILGFPGDVIVTLRTKNEKVVEENERGKKVVVDVILKPIQRDGIEYEFGIVGELDLANTLTIKKSRIDTFKVGDTFEHPDGEIIQQISDYLAAGQPLAPPQDYADRAVDMTDLEQLRALLDEVHRAGYDGSGVLDPAGASVALRDFVIECGKNLRAHTAEVPA